MTSLQFGLTFALAGFALLLAQVAIMDGWRAYRALYDAFSANLGHDTHIFPDYETSTSITGTSTGR